MIRRDPISGIAVSRLSLLPVMVAVLLAVPLQSAGGAAPKPKVDNAADAAPVEALPQRVGPQPFHALRDLGLVQDKVTQGDERSLALLPELQAETLRRLSEFPAEVWSDPRNQRAAIRFTFGGGDPSLLDSLVNAKSISESELPLALGALAFAFGDRVSAADHLAKVDARTLGQSLAGIVSLVKATLAADSDAGVAIGFCDDARLHSPGSLVEESALRISIELLRAAGDSVRLAATISRYLRRFGQSLYLPAVEPAMVRFIASRNLLSNKAGLDWFNGATHLLADAVKHKLLADIAEDALRFGKLATAEVASRRLLDALPANDPDRPRIMVFDAASRALSPQSAEALDAIKLANAGPLPAPVAELALAVSALGSAVSAKIEAAPIAPSVIGDGAGKPAKSGPAKSGIAAAQAPGAKPSEGHVRVRKLLEEADRLIAETAK